MSIDPGWVSTLFICTVVTTVLKLPSINKFVVSVDIALEPLGSLCFCVLGAACTCLNLIPASISSSSADIVSSVVIMVVTLPFGSVRFIVV